MFSFVFISPFCPVLSPLTLDIYTHPLVYTSASVVCKYISTSFTNIMRFSIVLPLFSLSVLSVLAQTILTHPYPETPELDPHTLTPHTPTTVPMPTNHPTLKTPTSLPTVPAFPTSETAQAVQALHTPTVNESLLNMPAHHFKQLQANRRQVVERQKRPRSNVAHPSVSRRFAMYA